MEADDDDGDDDGGHDVPKIEASSGCWWGFVAGYSDEAFRRFRFRRDDARRRHPADDGDDCYWDSVNDSGFDPDWADTSGPQDRPRPLAADFGMIESWR